MRIMSTLSMLGMVGCLQLGIAHAAGTPSDGYQNAVDDGAWCWFQSPRAVYYKGKHQRSYIGWINSRGDIGITSYDYKTKNLKHVTLHPRLQRDDHDNPGLQILEDGRILVQYSKHCGGEMLQRVSKNPEDISEWGEEEVLKLNPTEKGRSNYTYANFAMLGKESNRIYSFWRGAHWKPTMSYSDDQGKSWAPGEILISHIKTNDNQRPYSKYHTDGEGTIHFAFTDGHPRAERKNRILYMTYKKGAFYRADGSKIGTLDDLPLNQAECDIAYDAHKTNIRGWIWDIATDKKGYPVIVYTRLPKETDHRYHYVRWDGSKWHDVELCKAGKWFPQTPKGKREREPHYSGGIVMDHGNPDLVYLSRPVNGVFEIEKWTTKDNGQTWSSTAVTSGSKHDNVRPFVIRNAPATVKPRVIWMNNNGQYIHYTRYNSTIKMDLKRNNQSAKR